MGVLAEAHIDSPKLNMKMSEMMRILRFFQYPLFLLVKLTLLQAQPAFEWSSQISHYSSLEAYSVAIDNEGSVYTLGFFQEEADFDPGDGSFIMIPEGPSDFFLQKLDSTGQFIWAKKLGGNGRDGATQPPPPADIAGNAGRVKVDNNGNVYVTGIFDSDSIDLDPNVGLNYAGHNDRQDLLVVKLDPEGNLIWGHTFGGIYNEFLDDAALDTLGNLYLLGRFQDTVDFDPSPSSQATLVAQETYDTFLQKLSPDGELEWVQSLPGIAVWRVETDANNNVYFSGSISDTTDFDPGSGEFIVNADGPNHGFILKLNSVGEFVSVYVHSHGVVSGPTFAIDQENDIWLMSGFGSGSILTLPDGNHPIQSTGNNICVLKISEQGGLIYEGYLNGWVLDMCVDPLNAVYLEYSEYNNPFDADPGPATVSVEQDNGHAVIKLLESGDFSWVGLIDGPTYYTTRAIIADSDENVYLAGGFRGYPDFDPSPNEAQILTSFNNYQTDAYTIKWSQEDTTVGIGEVGSDYKMMVYPNPAKSELTIETPECLDENGLGRYDMQIFAVSGKMIMNQPLKCGVKTRIDLGVFANGLYNVQIADRNGSVWNKKVSVVK